ncbi:MAG: hypothetical protein ABSE51_23640 [Terracidiphilus sp.]
MPSTSADQNPANSGNSLTCTVTVVAAQSNTTGGDTPQNATWNHGSPPQIDFSGAVTSPVAS